MTKQEFIKYLYSFEKERSHFTTDFLMGIRRALVIAEQLDEPSREECELIEERDDWDCLQSLTCSNCNNNVYDNYWRDFKFCPECGAKIKGV